MGGTRGGKSDIKGGISPPTTPLAQLLIIPALSITLCCFCRTAGIQQKAAFSVARGTNEYPDKTSIIRFTTVITNIEDDYDTNTGKFR